MRHSRLIKNEQRGKFALRYYEYYELRIDVKYYHLKMTIDLLKIKISYNVIYILRILFLPLSLRIKDLG